MLDLLLSPFAPHICCGCADYGSILCQSCKYDIENEDFGRCIWCLRPTHESHHCIPCRQKTGARGAWAVGERSGALKQLLNDYKFESRREAAGTLAALLDITIPVLPDDTIVTWVPTSPSHIRQRGFDHAALLARRFAKLRGLHAKSLLQRRHSLSQHELSRTARAAAAQRAFERNSLSIEGPVLLIDDILTTGATLAACTKLLAASGAEVYIAIVARQPA